MSDSNEFYNLVKDEPVDRDFPRNFRTSLDPYETVEGPFPVRQGLDELHASASAQFSEHSFQNALAKIQKPFMVVDLRQESHFFINGIPVSEYAYRNSGNRGKSSKAIETLEADLKTAVQAHPVYTVYRIKKTAAGHVYLIEPEVWSIEGVESEKEVVKRLGGEYFRLHVQDHHAPSVDQIDQFIEFVKTVPSDVWLHFHCRGGRGRATTFMTLYDIIKNGRNVSLEDIVLRQHLIGGRLLSSSSNEKGEEWKKRPSEKRYQIVKDFYAYANDPKGLYHQSWKEWLAQRETLTAEN